MEQLIDNSRIPTLSERIFMQGDTTNESTITTADIEKVEAKLPQGKAQKKIGFWEESYLFILITHAWGIAPIANIILQEAL